MKICIHCNKPIDIAEDPDCLENAHSWCQEYHECEQEEMKIYEGWENTDYYKMIMC